MVCVGVRPGEQTLLRHQARPTQTPCYTRCHVHHLPTLASRKGLIFYLLLRFITRKEHLEAMNRRAFGVCKMLTISSDAFSPKESHTQQKHDGPGRPAVHCSAPSARSSLPAHPRPVHGVQAVPSGTSEHAFGYEKMGRPFLSI